MSHWYQTNYFQDSLMVRRSIDSSFIALRSLIKIYGSAHPFTVASNYFPIPRIENYFEQFHPSQGLQQQFASNPTNNGLDAFNQYQILNFQYKQQQQLQQPQQLPMNFLAQPFPTINKPPLPGSNRVANNQPKFSQLPPSQPQVMPANGYSVNAPNNFQISPKPMLPLPNSLKFVNNQIQPPPPISFPQQQRFDSNSSIGMESIQKALFDIQRQHELQQSMNLYHFQQQDQNNPQPSASVNKVVSPQSSPQKSLPPSYMMENYDYNTNEEDDFQKVDYHRKKRNQKEKEAANKIVEKNKSRIINSDTSQLKQASSSDLNPMRKNVQIIEEKSLQSTIPAPWFRNVVVSQNDDKTINNIEFTFANNQFQPVEPWPKISPEKEMPLRDLKKTSAADGEKSTQPSLPAPWLKANQSDDGKSLKKILIEEEEENRKLQLKRERERQIQESKEKKQNELAKTVWKPIIVGCVDKEKGIEGEDLHLPLTKKNSNQIAPKKKECEQTAEEREFDNWCVETLMKLNPNIDSKKFLPTFIIIIILFVLFYSSCIFDFFAIN